MLPLQINKLRGKVMNYGLLVYYRDLEVTSWKFFLETNVLKQTKTNVKFLKFGNDFLKSDL